MEINLVKKYSLNGLADGWTDETFVRVEMSSTLEVAEWQEKGYLKMVGPESYDHLRKVLTEKIKSGKVLSTNKETGKGELVEFGPSDTKKVVEALPNAILQDIMQLSLGFPQRDLTL